MNETMTTESTTSPIWNKRLSSILVALLGFSFISILAVGSYYDQPITQILSFNVYDEHCQLEIHGVGQHCFGDFVLQMNFIN